MQKNEPDGQLSYKWEWIHLHESTIWNRVFNVPAQFCKPGGEASKSSLDVSILLETLTIMQFSTTCKRLIQIVDPTLFDQ